MVSIYQQQKILIVDDVPLNVQILAQTLSSEYQIKIATNGADALSIALREQPDLILLDIMMPGMNGLDVCRQLKANADTFEIPVIFTTALSAESDEEFGLKLGAIDFVTKPFSIPIIKARIHNHLQCRLLKRQVAKHTAALTESEQYFRSTFEQVPIGVVNVSLQGYFLEVNQWCSDILGYSRDELLSMTYRQVTHPAYLDSGDDRIKRVLAGEMSGFTEEKQYICKDGRVIWGALSVKLICYPDGSPSHFVAIIEGIDQRKQTEQALRNLSIAVEQSPSSIMITDIRANIEYVNNTFCKTTGYSREEVIGKNPRLLRSGKTPDATYEDLWSTLIGGHIWRGEFNNKRKNGVEYIESALIAPVHGPNGKITHFIGIRDDITERKKLDQLLQQQNADLVIAKSMAEEASNAKSVFLSRMSHELRTPLNAILGYAQLLEAGTPPLLETQYKRLEPIISAGWYLLELINEILDLNAIESGIQTLSPESLSIFDVLLECQILVQAQAEKENILLDFIPCDSSWTIYVDKTRIKQILLNLLSNAIKYNRVQVQRECNVALF